MSTLFKNAAISGGIEGIIVGMMSSLGQAVEKHGEGFIKSRMFGFGTNDNHLFQSAAAYAVSQLGVSVKNIIRICKVINSYGTSQRNRIIETIGKNEEDVSTSSKTAAAKSGGKNDGTGKDDKNDKPSSPSRGSARTNVEGAYILAMLAKMTDDQIKEFFAASGMLDTVVVKVKEAGKKAAAKITAATEKGGFIKDAESFFEKKTWLERFADGKI